MRQIKLTLYKKNGKKVYYNLTDKIRRVSHRLSLSNYVKAHLYVTDGKKLNHEGKMVVFYNEAYVTPNNAREMLYYFWEG